MVRSLLRFVAAAVLTTACDSAPDGTMDAGPDAAMDAGPDEMDAGPDAPDAGLDAGSDGGCPAAASVSMPCCEVLGAGACGVRMFCAALDGESAPTCHLEHSRDGGASCTEDVQCASDLCLPSGACEVPTCTKNVVVMGFWPPSNEMLRPWSTNPDQNAEGWVGENWEGYGYDVYSFFPEFPPDGDPTNDAIGSAGSVGSPLFDLQVDYQETSADFWRIVDEYQPVILLTSSRTSTGGWVIEALDGGHGTGAAGPELDWYMDGWDVEFYPTQSTIDPRSWDAISTYRVGNTLPTQLPANEIITSTSALGLAAVSLDTFGTSGNFLSGFLALHGLYYNSIAPHNVAAGHIHVGGSVAVDDATTLVQTTLRTIIEQHPLSTTTCPGG